MFVMTKHFNRNVAVLLTNMRERYGNNARYALYQYANRAYRQNDAESVAMATEASKHLDDPSWAAQAIINDSLVR